MHGQHVDGLPWDQKRLARGRGANLPGLRATPAVIQGQPAPRAVSLRARAGGGHSLMEGSHRSCNSLLAEQVAPPDGAQNRPKITAAATTWGSANLLTRCSPSGFPGDEQTGALVGTAYCTVRSGTDTCRRQYNVTLKIPQSLSEYQRDSNLGPEGR